jgi:hypothetical protein
LTGKNGGREFGCQVLDHSGAYDRLEMTFMGTGISEGGESPKMIVDANCRSQKDLNQLEPVWIPMDALMQNPAKNQTYDVGGESALRISLQSMPDQWPENWVLWSVRFYREDSPDEALVVDANMLKQARAKLLSFDWKASQ